MREGSRAAGVVALVLLISVSLQGKATEANLGLSTAALEGRWTSSERAPLGGGRPAAAYDSESDRIVLFGDTDGYGRRSETWAYDYNTNQWTSRHPPTSPRPVRSPAIAYDARADRMVLFGGLFGTSQTLLDVSLGETWTFDLNANLWQNRTRGGGPPPRHYSAMAYDAESDRTILFGGVMDRSSPPGRVWLNDTWAYDHDANRWTNMTTAVRPPASLGHSLLYHARSDRILLVGASGGEVWSYDYNANVWTKRSGPGGPPIGSQAAYDVQSDRIMSYGAVEVPAPPGTPSPGTWVYDVDLAVWERRGTIPNPTSRGGHVVVYDGESDRVILFGGRTIASAMSRDTWAYDLGGDVWKYMGPAPRPAPRRDHAMVYDEGSDRVVMFGGAFGDFGSLNDTWSYDANVDRWARLSNTSSPQARWGHAMAHDSESNRSILFGGWAGFGTSLNDTWTYSLGTNIWMNVTPAVSPPPRSWPGIAYDSESDKTILFGGWTVRAGRNQRLTDTWAYDLNTNTWVDMTPAFGPSLLGFDVAVYDVNSDRVVLVTGLLLDQETWTYDFNTNAWTIKSARTTSFVTTFEAAAFDREADRAVLFSGETWSYDLERNTWSEIKTSEPPHGRSSHAMAYDRESDRIILFGGGRATDLSLSSDFNDTWLLEFPSVEGPGMAISILDLTFIILPIAAGAVVAYVLITRRRRRLRAPPPPSPPKAP